MENAALPIYRGMIGDLIRHVLTELTEEIMKVIRLGLSRCFGMFQEFDMLRGIWAFMHVEIFNIRMCKLDRGGASVYFFSIKDDSEQSNSFYITDFHSPSFCKLAFWNGNSLWSSFLILMFLCASLLVFVFWGQLHFHIFCWTSLVLSLTGLLPSLIKCCKIG